MVRVKIPGGKLTSDQLIKLAEAAETYSNGNIHITTRQCVQYHFVKLNDTPKLWKDISESGLTLREACGNTVRNITASANAGIDNEEAFDVTPYVKATYDYFLRNLICQELGRKIKIAFSSSNSDSAFTFFNDFGFIPVIRDNNEKGFKVFLGGGLGAQPRKADVIFDFLEEQKIIPFMEGAIRVFDRLGERKNRNKARMKFLINKLGHEEFVGLVQNEISANKIKEYSVNNQIKMYQSKFESNRIETPIEKNLYDLWLKHNVVEQKQEGYYSAEIKVQLGNIEADKAKEISKIVKKYAADDIRLNIHQGILLRFIRKENLPAIFNSLYKIKLHHFGCNSLADITSCPGTDTCSLGITNSTNLAVRLEKMIYNEF